MVIRSPYPRLRIRQVWRGALLAGLLAGTQLGCGREFFRDWANQDVSEAVFEKSRDPRWRLDTFSVEPPALSRFADPYDQDFPPAPPDDPATEAISPAPQWPDNRVLVPVEGTGYVDLLEKWRAENPPEPGRPANQPGRGGNNGSEKGDNAQRQVEPKPPVTGSPFSRDGVTPPPPNPNPPRPSGPGGGAAIPAPRTYSEPVRPGSGAGLSGSAKNTNQNSGTISDGKTPIILADGRVLKPKGAIPPPRPASSFKLKDRPAGAGIQDAGVRRASRQAGSGNQPPGRTAEGQPAPDVPRDVTVPLDPNPTERDLADPNLPRPVQLRPAGPGGVFDEAQAAELAGILVPSVPDLNEAATAGLPSNSRPYRITMQQAFTLALINSRFYQTNLENLYSSALTVTLQRFAFTPQFYAGLSPRTSPLGAGFPVLNPLNSFNYQTLEAPGGQVSSMQIGTIAGYGKLLNSGGQLLMGFANQVIFNFVGPNPKQPSVRSSLPLTFVQPFLRGGGRAVTLEPLTLAERSLLYQTRAFAKFRQEFLVTILTGGFVQNFGSTFQLAGFSSGGNIDPTIGFIPVVIDVAQIDINRRNVAAFEQLVFLFRELIKGEPSGLTQLQVDQAESSLVSAQGALVQSTLTYRSDLDQFKVQMGLPPDLELIPDLALIRPFQAIYKRIDDWQKDPKRNLEDLPGIVNELPELEDVVIDGRSVLSIYKGKKGFNEEDQLEDILQSGVRTALEFRLDLMNARAQLYDAWRQIRVAANALKGFLNISVTNQILTPPTTTNPFAFVDQAKQFSLVLNAELPLIRLSERNAFRLALIRYQQQRRQLQNTEDNVKYQLRQDIRSLQVSYINYEIAKRNLILNIRLKDQAFEQIIAPPQGGAGAQGLAQAANAATQTSNLIQFQSRLIQSELQLIQGWQTYQAARLTLYRDIGTLPYDEWEAFSELFPSEYRGPSLGPHNGDTRPAAAPAAVAAESVAR